MRLPELRPRLPLLGVALAAGLGIFAADCCRLASAWPLAIAAVLALALAVRPHTITLWGLVATGFFALHTVRHYGSEGRLLSEALGPDPVMAEATGLVWSEPQMPHVWSRETSCRFLLKLETLRAGGVERATSAVVPMRWSGEVPAYGDRVSILGSLRPLEPVRNPGVFDYAAWERRQGLYLQLASRYPADCRVLSHGHGAWPQELALASQRWIRRCLEVDLQDAPEVSSLIECMLLGAQGDTSDDIRELFQRTGTMHLFAVSGFNVALLALCAWFVGKPLGLSRRGAVFVIIPLLALYALITGLGASCVRASLTGSLLLLGFVCDRRPPPLNSVAAAALLILAVDSEQLFSTGFQFSFVVVVCLILGARRVERWLQRFGRPDPFLPKELWSWRQRGGTWAWGRFSSALSVNFIGWAGSLAFTVGYFHLFSPAALAANLLAVPLSCLILFVGTSSLAAGAFSAGLAGLFNNANWVLAKGLLAILQGSAALPGSYAYLQPALPARAACEVTVLDAGSGGAIHLRAGGRDWMIDCAHGWDYEQGVRPYLHARGLNSLDGLILTHGDAQHIGGALPLLADFRPALVLDSPLKDRSAVRRQIHAALAARGLPKRLVWRGDVIEAAPGVTLRVLYPPLGLQRAAADDKALVISLSCEGLRGLFTSDSGFATENWLVENEPDLHADFLVKGEHAHDLSGTPDFLRAVHPQLLVSAAPDLHASRPEHAAWEQAVEEQGIALFAQERTGAVHLTLRDGELRAESFLGGQTFRSRAR